MKQFLHRLQASSKDEKEISNLLSTSNSVRYSNDQLDELKEAINILESAKASNSPGRRQADDTYRSITGEFWHVHVYREKAIQDLIRLIAVILGRDSIAKGTGPLINDPKQVQAELNKLKQELKKEVSDRKLPLTWYKKRNSELLDLFKRTLEAYTKQRLLREK